MRLPGTPITYVAQLGLVTAHAYAGMANATEGFLPCLLIAYTPLITHNPDRGLTSRVTTLNCNFDRD